MDKLIRNLFQTLLTWINDENVNIVIKCCSFHPLMLSLINLFKFLQNGREKVMLVCVKINSVIAQKIRVYRLGTSPNQLWNGYLASGGPMNQDSECQMDEGRSRRWGTSCFRFIRSLLAFERRPRWKGETVRGNWHERRVWTRSGIVESAGDLITVFSATKTL